MSIATFIALTAFSFASSITPGPNNIMLLTSGLNFGVRKTVPHALGIAFGFGILLAAVGAGIGAIIQIFPWSFGVIKILGGTYMLYLAWRIATTNTQQNNAKTEKSRPMKFYEAALFQWVNPKAWVMAVVAMSAYTAEGNYVQNVVVVTITFCAINLPCVSLWAACGAGLRRFLSDPTNLKIFNWTMALALVLSLWPMLTVEAVPG